MLADDGGGSFPLDSHKPMIYYATNSNTFQVDGSGESYIGMSVLKISAVKCTRAMLVNMLVCLSLTDKETSGSTAGNTRALHGDMIPVQHSVASL